ncbi:MULTISPECIES: methylmalonyl Co-A mutase-associated GTPase MeaB [Neobacillus]|jgi:LAO/AO transport system kinase|uniref:Methylmalonyl Co-A mutase-associated GTPase MeaB n=1 Tax=Neobacillus sedimentimangrovi TaxID=2699460 RepID=A0ABS8QMT2_9BACI|nr:methylmalonyl Co-A mutase-associated GTPase MeaB [Neobacillus sedimentimangrovi]AIM15538.1 transporter [Bacillus sp. X1(2014)]MCD4839609.1 methylmalonyl Co-A mutase-associated GTPase MeaB [Neobacillus sedimentimangrovi]
MSMDQRPEWSDPNKPEQCSSFIRKGDGQENHPVSVQKYSRFQKHKSTEPTVQELYEGVLKGDRSLLARAITLVESNAERHFQKSQQLLQMLLPHTGKAIRVGITGVPGAGKSTFIEAFGTYLCGLGLRIAVLAIDPSSSISGGSILGDKTRMEQLARNPHAFIRPSPTAGKLGGVHRKTREAMLICEAAGFDVILIETVGVGQSEVIIRDMVDFFMLLVLTGAGDELQGMKKGIMELADAIIVHKADGDNKPIAEKTKREYNRILHFLQPATRGWQTKAYTCSSLTKEGIGDIWKVIQSFEQKGKASGVFEERRKSQSREWMYSMITDHLHYQFYQHPDVKNQLPKFENKVIAGDITVATAVEKLFQLFLDRKN